MDIDHGVDLLDSLTGDTADMTRTLNRIFSGIQPTGVPHLGNYFGAVSQWIQTANSRSVLDKDNRLDCDTPIFSIVDVHAYSSSNCGPQLYKNLMSTTASLLALGIDPKKCILFRQSDLFEHNFLCNVLDNFVSPGRLRQMTQFKEKTRSSQQISNGLLNYPVLQAADILLYRANLVPVGEDQVQHIELTRDVARKFNSFAKRDLFPEPRSVLNVSEHARRLKSLRDPDKKMSKSDPNKKSFVEVIDEPDVVVEKCKKALTDSTSAVYYDPVNRPAVANLMRLYHLTTGLSFDSITKQFAGIETAQFKLELAEAIIEHFRGARDEYKRLRNDEANLEATLELGAEKARPIAAETIREVRHILGSIDAIR